MKQKPRYWEGQILKKTSKYYLVEWHDSAKEKISLEIGKELSKFKINQWFGCWVLLGKNNVVISVERVEIRKEVDFPENWPTKV